jgi:hypothetical protein
LPESLLVAIGLVFLLEGIVPFLFPSFWKGAFKKVTSFKNGQIRFFGFLSTFLGIITILIVN